jgi:hypothetical protein
VDYEDFEIRIGAREGSATGFPVTVTRSYDGEQAHSTFEIPFTQSELENSIRTIENAIRGTRNPVRSVRPDDSAEVRKLGSRLFDALMRENVRRYFEFCLNQANKAKKKGVRIRLRLEAEPLCSLPWEYLYDAQTRDFLCLSNRTPLVRYLDVPRDVEPLVVSPPLSILVGVALLPTDRHLEIDKEVQRISDALSPLCARGSARVTVVKHLSLNLLQTLLRQDNFHIFHFIGHGTSQTESNEGILVFEHEEHGRQEVSGESLGILLHDHPSLRVVVLNACEGARSSLTDPFSSVAGRLVLSGIPSTIAMQFEITDAASLEFSKTLYQALADNYPVDAALAEARKAMVHASHLRIEWGTPVLYLRSLDGRLFDIDTRSSRPNASYTSSHSSDEFRVLDGSTGNWADPSLPNTGNELHTFATIGDPASSSRSYASGRSRHSQLARATFNKLYLPIVISAIFLSMLALMSLGASPLSEAAPLHFWTLRITLFIAAVVPLTSYLFWDYSSFFPPDFDLELFYDTEGIEVGLKSLYGTRPRIAIHPNYDAWLRHYLEEVDVKISTITGIPRFFSSGNVYSLGECHNSWDKIGIWQEYHMVHSEGELLHVLEAPHKIELRTRFEKVPTKNDYLKVGLTEILKGLVVRTEYKQILTDRFSVSLVALTRVRSLPWPRASNTVYFTKSDEGLVPVAWGVFKWDTYRRKHRSDLDRELE